MYRGWNIAACDYKSTNERVQQKLAQGWYTAWNHPAGTIRRSHVDPMLVQRIRRWPKIRSTQGQRTGPAGVGPTLIPKWLKFVWLLWHFKVLFAEAELASFTMFVEAVLASFTMFVEAALASFTIFVEAVLASFTMFVEAVLTSFTMFAGAALASFTMLAEAALASFTMFAVAAWHHLQCLQKLHWHHLQCFL